MTTFSFKTIDATDAQVLLACFEGDNEIVVAMTGMSKQPYETIVVNHGADEPFEVVRESFSTARDAVYRVTEFLRDEYAGA